MCASVVLHGSETHSPLTALPTVCLSNNICKENVKEKRGVITVETPGPSQQRNREVKTEKKRKDGKKMTRCGKILLICFAFVFPPFLMILPTYLFYLPSFHPSFLVFPPTFRLYFTLSLYHPSFFTIFLMTCSFPPSFHLSYPPTFPPFLPLSLPLFPLCRSYLRRCQSRVTQGSLPLTTYEFWLTLAVSDSSTYVNMYVW